MGQCTRLWYLLHIYKCLLTNSHADISSGARGLMFGLRLHLYPYLVYVGVKVQNFLNPELFKIKSLKLAVCLQVSTISSLNDQLSLS